MHEAARSDQEDPVAPRFLDRPGGRLAYDLQGSGPLALCMPGMGDLRSVYRFLAPALAEAGFRVATVDLRGHGDSDATFSRYDDVAAGSDLIALHEHLGGGPALLIGNSMGAAAAAWAAAEAPDRVAGLVLIGPFVRDVPVPAAARLALRVGLWRPWGPAAWRAYYARLYPGRSPDDLSTHLARLRASLSRPEHWRAFVATTRTSHAPVEARLAEITTPCLVAMGEKDPDFPDPAVEAQRIAGILDAEQLLVPNAGHYPHAEFPEVVSPAIVAFAKRVVPDA